MKLQKGLHRVVIDTCSLINLEICGLLELILKEFEVIEPTAVISELQGIAKGRDKAAKIASKILSKKLHGVDIGLPKEIIARRVQSGELYCLVLAKREKAVVITDDFKAMHELLYYAKKFGLDIGPSAILIKVLVLRGKISMTEALKKLDNVSKDRDWFERPLYWYSKKIVLG